MHCPEGWQGSAEQFCFTQWRLEAQLGWNTHNGSLRCLPSWRRWTGRMSLYFVSFQGLCPSTWCLQQCSLISFMMGSGSQKCKGESLQLFLRLRPRTSTFLPHCVGSIGSACFKGRAWPMGGSPETCDPLAAIFENRPPRRYYHHCHFLRVYSEPGTDLGDLNVVSHNAMR